MIHKVYCYGKLKVKIKEILKSNIMAAWPEDYISELQILLCLVLLETLVICSGSISRS